MAKWEPFEEIKRLEDEIDDIFNQFWKSTRIPRLSLPKVKAGKEIVPFESEMWSPAVDVVEKEKEIIVKCDLPGVDKKDVKIKINSESVTISGELKKEKKQNEENYYVEERVYGAFSKIVPLPAEVDPEKAQAKFENGVLELAIPKVEIKKFKEITL
jgi:HSP20 family protein